MSSETNLIRHVLGAGIVLAAAGYLVPRSPAPEPLDAARHHLAAAVGKSALSLRDEAETPGELALISRDQWVAELRAVSGSDPEVYAHAARFHVMEHGAARRLVTWFHRQMKAMKVEFRPEIWDCDDYSRALTSFGDYAALQHFDLTHGFAWGRMIVDQHVPWGGVPANQVHELVLIHTNRGFIVVEPQSGQRVALERYPNRNSILEVFID